MLDGKQGTTELSTLGIRGIANTPMPEAQRRLLLGSVAAIALFLIGAPVTVDISDHGTALSMAKASADDDDHDDSDDDDDDDDDDDNDDDDSQDDSEDDDDRESKIEKEQTLLSTECSRK